MLPTVTFTRKFQTFQKGSGNSYKHHPSDRVALINGERALADFLEKAPQAPTPF